ncbi:uncharacterized protein K460DRAFT_391713 [Cucurbitaria berberidis CBS 394.84]|uniref:Uncharacterized protein n=1 Tax=Cucurbitaria berberidis CBS 394.84 TaxID=1168544 RepID=A0A9P4GUV6_9PLEO|nr:uncharacterized protein K460DRAFT_391713 [Cucurbitaria berberidis CBS 394.84]KAF1851441.1 hypothetical protein K460DRAFT_391713 [Cucurbitaria berberidis CBS 394.84]
MESVATKQRERKSGESGGNSKQQQQPEQLQVVSNDLPVKPNGSVDHDHAGVSQHQRGHSLHVNWTLEDVARLARELYNKTIADVHLSLFGYWIQESEEHYDVAKQHIRELNLDQGYNVERIENVHLRKLLKDVQHVRPKCVSGLPPVDRVLDSRQSKRSRLLAPVAANNALSLRGVSGLVRPRTNKVSFREPLHAAAVKIQTLVTTPWRGPAIKSRSTSSPVTAKIEALPPSFRAERERAMREAARSTSLSSVSPTNKGYPPDTPDRPAPLSLGSRSSRESSATPTTTNLSRSFSSPARNIHSKTLIPLPLAQNTAINQTTSLYPLLANSARSPRQTDREAGTDDVFGIVDGGVLRQGDRSDDMQAVRRENSRNGSRRYASRQPYNQHIPGPYELDALENTSTASHEADETQRMNRDASIGVSSEGEEDHILQDGTSDGVWPDSGLDDKISLLETASTVSDTDSPNRYSYTLSAPPPDTVIAESAPTPSSPRTAVQSQHKIKHPLLSYESEAHIHPASGVQSGSHDNRGNPTHTKPMRCSRPRPSTVDPLPFGQAIPLPPRPGLITAQVNYRPSRPVTKATSGSCLSTHIEPFGKAQVRKDVTEPHANSTSQDISMASMLAAFPIPPMESPVGELPMTISRATAYSELATGSTSVAETYRSTTKAQITELLHRTRRQGAQLPVLDWNDLSTFEQAWREVNEQLLVSIYGRKDTVLTSQDVQYVDCISRELRGGTYSHTWVRDLFQAGI